MIYIYYFYCLENLGGKKIKLQVLGEAGSYPY